MKTKIIAVMIALIVMVSLGSATLVGYLSNTVENDVTITSPLAITEFEIDDIVAGSTTCLDVSVTNSANRNVCGYFEVAVTDGGEPFDCEGIEMEGKMDCMCVEDDCLESFCEGGVYVFPACICFTAGEIETFEAKIYAHPLLADGDYEFDTTIRPCGEENYGWNAGTNCECDEYDVDAMCGGCCESECLCGYYMD